MPVTFSLPSEYGYVIATTSFTFFLNAYLTIRVGNFRKAAAIPYPKPYADSGDFALPANASASKQSALYLFNCAQRAHANFLEHVTPVVVSVLVTGVKYPVAASVLGMGWALSRVAYSVGYTSDKYKTGRGRYWGVTHNLFELGVLGLLGWMGVGMVL